MPEPSTLRIVDLTSAELDSDMVSTLGRTLNQWSQTIVVTNDEMAAGLPAGLQMVRPNGQPESGSLIHPAVNAILALNQESKTALVLDAKGLLLPDASLQTLLDKFCEDESSPLASISLERDHPHQLQQMATLKGVGYIHCFDLTFDHPLVDPDQVFASRPCTLPASLPQGTDLSQKIWGLTGLLRGTPVPLNHSRYIPQNEQGVLFNEAGRSIILFPKKQLLERFGQGEYIGTSCIADKAPHAGLKLLDGKVEAVFSAPLPPEHVAGTFKNHSFALIASHSGFTASLDECLDDPGFFYYITQLTDSGGYDFAIEFVDDELSWQRRDDGVMVKKNGEVLYGRQAVEEYFKTDGHALLGRINDLENFDQLLAQGHVRGTKIPMLNNHGEEA